MHLSSLRPERLWVLSSFFFFLLLPATHGRELRAQGFDLTSFLDANSVLQQRLQQDRAIQQAAFQFFDHHKTGEVYNVSFSGIPIGSVILAMRLRTGSLRKYGLVLDEFSIPPGSVMETSPERVVIVYENLNKSPLFPVDSPIYELVGPVVGIFAYDASDLTTSQPLPKLSIFATHNPISIRVPFSTSAEEVTPLCAFFEDNSAAVAISNLASLPAVCNTTRLGSGFFSLVAKIPTAPSPSPFPSQTPSSPSVPASSPSPVASSSPITASVTGTQLKGKHSNTRRISVGSTVGALALVFLLSITASVALRRRRAAKIQMMEYRADQGETLQTSLIGSTRAPTAGATRTLPKLETDFVV